MIYQLFTIILFSTIVIIILLVGFIISYNRLKKNKNNQLQYLNLALKLENKKANQLTKKAILVNENNSAIQVKLVVIKNSILNISFTIDEIFN